MCKLEIFQCMHSGTGAPHKSHWPAASTEGERASGAHANSTDICWRKLKICGRKAKTKEPLAASTPVRPPPPPSLYPFTPGLSCSTPPPPHTPPHSLLQRPLANRRQSDAGVQATEMGHFLIKYNINYCEHHYRYVRID